MSGLSVLSRLCDRVLSVFSSHLAEEERASCFTLIVLCMFVYLSVSSLFSHGALGLAVVMFLLMHCLLMHPIVFGVLCLVFAMLYCTLCHF